MAFRKRLIFVAAFAALNFAFPFGCTNAPAKAENQAAQWDVKEERQAIAVARHYLRDRRLTTKEDFYAASPYGGGWLVRVNRQTGKNPDGSRAFDFRQERFVKVDENWRVVEYIPGAGGEF
jgi:hypothetical protein